MPIEITSDRHRVPIATRLSTALLRPGGCRWSELPWEPGTNGGLALSMVYGVRQGRVQGPDKLRLATAYRRRPSPHCSRR
jgi:hypothetical protein